MKILRGGETVTRRVHTPEIAGSTPVLATILVLVVMLAGCAGVRFSFPAYAAPKAPPCMAPDENRCASPTERRALAEYILRLQGEFEKCNRSIEAINNG